MEKETRKQLKELQGDIQTFKAKYYHLLKDGEISCDFHKIECRLSLLKDEYGMYIMADNYI